MSDDAMPAPDVAQADEPPVTGDDRAAAEPRGIGPSWLPGLLIILATILAIVSATTTWVNSQALDTDDWVKASERLIEDDEVREALAEYLTDQLYEEVDPDYRHAGIDLAIIPGLHGRGYGAEAVALLSRHLFENRGHHRIVIDPNAANEAAIRAYEKVGFRKVGRMRRYEFDHTLDEWTDGMLMDLLPEDLIDPPA